MIHRSKPIRFFKILYILKLYILIIFLKIKNTLGPGLSNLLDSYLIIFNS